MIARYTKLKCEVPFYELDAGDYFVDQDGIHMVVCQSDKPYKEGNFAVLVFPFDATIVAGTNSHYAVGAMVTPVSVVFIRGNK